MKKIAFILPYFGKFKNYFPLWVQSCKNNPTVDWLLFTDQTFDFEMPANIHVTQLPFEQFKTKLQRVFAFPVALETPYKLCDFKPAYGLALKQELAGYDFWGHCDCDLIFGDIRHFVTDEMLDKYDKLFTRGHLTLYRNTPKVNEFFKHQTYKPYQSILQDVKNHAFDEWPGISRAWDLSGQPYYDELIYDDIRHDLDGFRCTKEMNGYGAPYHRYNDSLMARKYRKMAHIVYRYDCNRLYRVYMLDTTIHQEEILYVHLQKRPMQLADELRQENSSFLIVPNRFLPARTVSSDLLRELSPDKLTFRNIMTHTKFLIHNLLKK